MVSSNAMTAGRLLSVATLGLMLAACASLEVGQDFDHSSKFSGYRTFSWMSREHHGARNPLVAQRARDAIQAELTRKGFTSVQDAQAADFVVDFTIGAQERVDIRSYPDPYVGPWRLRSPGWWGDPYWGSEVNVRNYREGTLSIDVFDAHTHRAVWHGWAKKELSQADIDRSEAPIRSAVAAVLEQFPPK